MNDNTFQIHKLETLVEVTGLVNVTYYKLHKGYIWSGEAHDFWEMVYVDKGELVITAGTDTYLLKAGEVAFHCPNEFHNLRTGEQTSANIIVIAFTCPSPMMQAFEKKILSLDQQEKQCLSSVVREAESAYVHFENVAPFIDLAQRASSPFGSQQIIKNLLEYFLILIYRHDDGINFDARAVSINQIHHHVQLVKEVQEYLQEHYSERITLEDLAARQNISLSQLKRVFKAQAGVPVISYLTSFRISEAKRLIRESTMNFSQIALAVGYDNIYYFSTLFKKHTGMTLTEYSKSIRV